MVGLTASTRARRVEIATGPRPGPLRARVANVFHAGDGNLHPLILFDGREPEAVERAHELAGEILAMCVELGGSITGEHAHRL